MLPLTNSKLSFGPKLTWASKTFESLAGVCVLLRDCKHLKPVAVLCQTQQPIQAVDLPAAAFVVLPLM